MEHFISLDMFEKGWAGLTMFVTHIVVCKLREITLKHLFRYSRERNRLKTGLYV